MTEIIPKATIKRQTIISIIILKMIKDAGRNGIRIGDLVNDFFSIPDKRLPPSMQNFKRKAIYTILQKWRTKGYIVNISAQKGGNYLCGIKITQEGAKIVNLYLDLLSSTKERPNRSIQHPRTRVNLPVLPSSKEAEKNLSHEELANGSESPQKKMAHIIYSLKSTPIYRKHQYLEYYLIASILACFADKMNPQIIIIMTPIRLKSTFSKWGSFRKTTK